jgi:hypothetical protein
MIERINSMSWSAESAGVFQRCRRSFDGWRSASSRIIDSDPGTKHGELKVDQARRLKELELQNDSGAIPTLVN